MSVQVQAIQDADGGSDGDHGVEASKCGGFHPDQVPATGGAIWSSNGDTLAALHEDPRAFDVDTCTKTDLEAFGQAQGVPKPLVDEAWSACMHMKHSCFETKVDLLVADDTLASTLGPYVSTKREQCAGQVSPKFGKNGSAWQLAKAIEAQGGGEVIGARQHGGSCSSGRQTGDHRDKMTPPGSKRVLGHRNTVFQVCYGRYVLYWYTLDHMVVRIIKHELLQRCLHQASSVKGEGVSVSLITTHR
jgi:hypothetical protein